MGAHRLGSHPEHHPGPGWSAPQGGPRAESGGAPVPLTVSTVPWAIWDLKTRNTGERYAWAFYALGVTLVRGSVYVLWVPALFGLVWFRDRFRLVPGAWVALVLSLLLSALLYRVAQVMGYLDERHLMLAILCGTYWTVAALAVTGARLAGWLGGRLPRWGDPRAVTLLLLLALAVSPLFKTLRTLNGERAGFRRAGAWLAAHAGPDDEVVDPYTWAGYYAGRVFLEGRPPAPGPHACYVVLEDGASAHDHLWFVLGPVAEMVKGHEPVEKFRAPRRGKPDGALLIYKLDRP